MNSSPNLQKGHSLANTLMLTQVNLGTTSEPQKCKIINTYLHHLSWQGFGKQTCVERNQLKTREEPQSPLTLPEHLVNAKLIT